MTDEAAASVEERLTSWNNSLFRTLPVAGLYSRNPVVYKWKAPMRCWILRETVFWRQHDLMAQSYLLYKQSYLLGARILLRSGFETLAVLVYLNQLIQQVMDGELSFQNLSDKTSILLLGTRNNDELPNAINVLTVLERSEKKYPGLKNCYANLSESAHPNYEGLCLGYSQIDHSNFETNFSNRWCNLFHEQHLSLMEICMETFEYEYDDVWPKIMHRFEGWIKENDALLKVD